MITDAGIKKAMNQVGPGGKASMELKDDGGRGEGRLTLILRANGDRISAEWYAVWWRDEKRRMVKLGTYPAISVADARKTFREEYAPAISAGRDPTGPKARRERRGMTVTDLFKAYVADLKATGKPSWKIAQNALLGPEKADAGGAASAIGRNVRAADVTTDDIREYLSEIYERGAVCQADSVRCYVHAAFEWAIKSANSYKGKASKVSWGVAFNPCSAIPTDTDAKRARDRYLKPSEVRVFWDWLAGKRSERRSAAALQLIMVTGQRLTEILRISEPTYDRREQMVDWSKTKNGHPHAIPLPPQGVEILNDLVPNAHGLYFSRALEPAKVAGIFGAERIVADFLEGHPDFAHFTPRDLRRTWKTLAGAAGISKETRDRLQNHARSDVSSRHYDRYDYLPEKRAAMKVWGAYLERILAGELDNPVTEMRARGA